MDFNRETGQKNAENDASVSSLIDVNKPHTEKRPPIPKKKMSKNYITFRLVFLVGIMILIAVLTGFHLKNKHFLNETINTISTRLVEKGIKDADVTYQKSTRIDGYTIYYISIDSEAFGSLPNAEKVRVYEYVDLPLVITDFYSNRDEYSMRYEGFVFIIYLLARVYQMIEKEHYNTNCTIEIHKNGITNLKTDAVVNAANQYLQQGGGVCGAIFRAAGSAQLQAACDRIGHCATGSAIITPAFNMKYNKYIIHAGTQGTVLRVDIAAIICYFVTGDTYAKNCKAKK